MPLQGDKFKVIFAHMVAHMWQDPAYEKEFLADPLNTLASEGITLPPGTNVVVHQSTPTIQYVKLPYRTNSAEAVADLQVRAPFLQKAGSDVEVRLVRDTATTVHVPIPAKPQEFDVTAMSLDALAGQAVAVPVRGVNVNVYDNVNAAENANVGAVDAAVVLVAT